MKAAGTYCLPVAVALAALLVCGCQTVVTLPINDSSHIRMAASPSNNDMISLTYYIYEDSHEEYRPRDSHSPVNIYDPVDISDWTAEIEFEQLGTAYTRDGLDPELAENLSYGWEIATEDGGIMRWENLEPIMLDGIERPEPKQKSPDFYESLERENARWERTSTLLPVANISTVLYGPAKY